MSTIWNSSHHIRNYDVDFRNQLKIPALFNYVQDAASLHAEHMQVGYSMLASEGLFWVLSWIKLVIFQFPGFAHEVRLTTWPKCSYKMFSIRDFICHLEGAEQPFCRATSAWLLLDAETKKIRKLDALSRRLSYHQDLVGLPDIPEKLADLVSIDFTAQKEMRYSDIDAHNHVNNARYIEALFDSYEHDFLATHQISELTVSFLSEMKFAEHLDIAVQTNSNPGGLHLLRATRKEDSKDILRARFLWQKRPV